MAFYKLPSPHRFLDKYDNKNTHLIVLQNSTGMQVALTDYGARIVSILVPNNEGLPTDVVLGFDTIGGYLHAHEKYHGATVGRYANRIANGTFEIDGKRYELLKNNGNNSLHGGARGFHDRVWDRQVSFRRKVDFYYASPDGEEGFPGNLNVHVSYELTNDNELKIRFRAVTDQKTILNLTNHAYFNLNGEGNGDIVDHVVRIPATQYVPLTEQQVPVGVLEPVAGTAMDFTEMKRIREALGSDHPQIAIANGLDHPYVNTMPLSESAATAFSDKSGIRLDVYTSEPSIHFYTGNFLDGSDTGKSGNKYGKNSGFCFEAQHFPDSPNQPSFPSVILDKGREFKSETIYKFSIKK